MKKVLITFVAIMLVFLAAPALATDNQAKLPTKFTYAKEWISLNLLTWKSESKVKVLDDFATKRVSDIQTASQSADESKISPLTDRYLKIKERETNRIETKNISTDTVNLVVERELERQRILSTIRQETKSEIVKNLISKAQEEAVNRTKSAIEKTQKDEDVKSFQDNVVAAWRDPKSEIDENQEKATRVFAEGTTSEGVSGVIIDGGEAKITKGDSGELKIEYAPGTGPSSVVDTNGKKKWTIQQSDGKVVESYTSGSQVVIGQSTGVSSNVIVNTIAGGTSSSAQNVVGGTNGTSSVIIEGGNPGVSGSSGDSSGSSGGQNVIE